MVEAYHQSGEEDQVEKTWYSVRAGITSCDCYIIITLILKKFVFAVLPLPAKHDYCSMVVFNLFYQSIKSLILGGKCVFKHPDLRVSRLKLTKYE